MIELLENVLEGAVAGFNVVWMMTNLYNFYPYTRRINHLLKSTKEEPSKERGYDPKISVLLPAYKEEKVLERTVNSIEKSGYSNLEVILLTEQGDESTSRIADTLQRRYPNVKHAVVNDESGIRGKPRALNQGLKYASGEITGVIDAEDLIDEKLFEKVADAFNNNDYCAVQGILKMRSKKESWRSYQFEAEYFRWYNSYLPRLAAAGYPLPLGGTTNFIRTHTLKELGGWKNGNLTEDYELALRIYEEFYGRNGLHNPVGMIASTTIEDPPDTLDSWLRQRTRWSQGKIMTAATHLSKPMGNVGKKLHVYMSNISAHIGAINFSGIALSTAFYFSRGQMPPVLEVLTLANLACVGAYCYMQGKSYADATKEGDTKHRLLKSLLVGITTPAYWFLQWVSELRASYRILTKRNDWEKTEHDI